MLDTLPRKPNKIPTSPLTLRVPTEMLGELNKIALDEDRSLNAQVIRMLREALQREREKDYNGPG
jgi:Arc-like DNA binding domain.